MAQMDEQRFAAAEQLWESGEARAAIVQHLDLVRHAHNLDVRLQSALLLVERLNPTSHDTEILECCSIGMKVAAELGDAATRVYLLGMLAKNLAIQNGSFLIARRNLRMAPGWLGFSLARDEEEYNALSSLIDANNKEIDRLTLEALEDNMDAATRGHLLLSLANVSLQRYFDVKIDSFRFPIRLPPFVRELLRSWALDEWLLHTASDRRLMHHHVRECERKYSEAVAAFRAEKDEVNVAHAFYALANDLRSANRFSKARPYLQQSETIARRLNEPQLLRLIPVLKERIRRRNRNVPNYAAQEAQLDR